MKNRFKNWTAASIVTTTFTAALASMMACSTASVRILPGEDGVHQSIAKDIERDSAETAALKGANEYCEKKKKEAVVVKNGSKYTGSMDENTRNTVRKASHVASILGPIGGVVQETGRAGQGMTNDRDYTAELSFKCQ